MTVTPSNQEFAITHQADPQGPGTAALPQARPAARMARVPVIVSSRRDLSQFAWYKTSRRVWLRRIQNLSNIVLANANSIREGLIAEDGFAPEKIRVIRNGVETETIQTTARDRERLFPGIGNSKLVVLVGNMHS